VPGLIKDLDLIKESRIRIVETLAAINGIILLIAGGLGYFLAGKTLQPIKTMLDEQNRFIGDASHELRTPLTALKTTTEVALRNKNLSLADTKKILAENVTEINQLQTLSDNLLQLTQYQNNGSSTHFKYFSLADIVQLAIKRTTPLADKKRIKIRNQTSNPQLFGNPISLTDALVIFLDNAIKYSPNLSVVTISSARQKDELFLSIKDQGIGIDQKDLPHIFDRFYRADSARAKANFGGYGLGLSIAKAVIDLHRGAISVTSKKNKGTTFTIKLPVAKNKNNE